MNAKRDPLTYADDILESIQAIERNTSNLELVWGVLEKDLPPLKACIEKILA